jgi:hypothetical protein
MHYFLYFLANGSRFICLSLNFTMRLIAVERREKPVPVAAMVLLMLWLLD